MTTQEINKQAIKAMAISKLMIEKGLQASTHAANAVKRMDGDKISQQTAGIIAKRLVHEGATGATAVEQGYRTGMRLNKQAA